MNWSSFIMVCSVLFIAAVSDDVVLWIGFGFIAALWLVECAARSAAK